MPFFLVAALSKVEANMKFHMVCKNLKTWIFDTIFHTTTSTMEKNNLTDPTAGNQKNTHICDNCRWISAFLDCRPNFVVKLPLLARLRPGLNFLTTMCYQNLSLCFFSGFYWWNLIMENHLFGESVNSCMAPAATHQARWLSSPTSSAAGQVVPCPSQPGLKGLGCRKWTS